VPHTVTNYQRGHYLIKCSKCGAYWRLHTKYVKFGKVKEAPRYRSKESESCIVCGATDTLASEVSSLRLWRKENPAYRPYHTEIACQHGTISSIRFNSVRDVKAGGTRIPYTIVEHSDEPVPVRGEFVTAKNLVLDLEVDCVQIESNFSVKPFNIIVTTSGVVLYKLSAVQVVDPKPFVSINLENNYGVLSPNVNFSAFLAYTDPVLTKD
jgi:hypothetical protein